MKFLNFFPLVWVTFALLDPDSNPFRIWIRIRNPAVPSIRVINYFLLLNCFIYFSAKMIPGKTPSQIQSHFENFYVGASTATEPVLQRLPPSIMRSDPFVPSPCPLALIAPLENPPRPVRFRVPSTSSTGGGGGWLSKDLPDYYPARGEFGVEYDNAAERDMELIAGGYPALEEALLLTSRRERDVKLDNDSTDEVAVLLTDLAVAMVERYNRRLRRRAAVRRLIREHGLISQRRVHAAAGRLQGVKCAAWGRSAHQWRAVWRLVSGGGAEEMDRLMEALLLEADIKCNILKLQKLRTEGEWPYVSFLCSWITAVKVLIPKERGMYSLINFLNFFA